MDKTLEPLLREAAVLTEFAWLFRYPGDADEPTLEEADEALTLALEVYEEIVQRLPEDARPAR